MSITATSLTHPSIKAKLMKAHKQALHNSKALALPYAVETVETRSGCIRVLYNRQQRSFQVFHANDKAPAQLQDITSLYAQSL